MHGRYWLSRDCFICASHGQLVCLDSRTWRYSVLPAETANAATAYIHGWPTVTPAADAVAISATSSKAVSFNVVNDLLDQGIFVTRRRRGHDPTKNRVLKPVASLIDDFPFSPVRPDWNEIFRFLLAALSSSFAFRRRGPRALLRARLKRRERLAAAKSGDVSPTEIQAIYRALMVFVRLRPLLLQPEKYGFLFERLVLARFLELLNHRPQWVFGVSANPLRTHSWLQVGQTVIDEELSVAAAHEPIVSI
jgi:hypothetical protein